MTGYNLVVSLKSDLGDSVLDRDGVKYNLAAAYDITFVDADGNQPTYDSKSAFLVSIEIPVGTTASGLKVMSIGNGGNNKLVSSYLSGESGNMITFSANHFSVYALVTSIPPVEDEPFVPPVDEPEEPARDPMILIAIALALLLLLLDACAGLIYIRHKYHGNIDEQICNNCN